MKDNIIVESETFKRCYGDDDQKMALYYSPFNLISPKDFENLLVKNENLAILAKGEARPEGPVLIEHLRTLLVNNVAIEGVNETLTDEAIEFFPARMIINGMGDENEVLLQERIIEIKNIATSHQYNFLFSISGNYFGVSPLAFKNSIKKCCYDEESNTLREDLVLQMLIDFEETNDMLFSCLKFRPINISLGKILQMFLPCVKSSVISDIVTFINATKNSEKVESVDSCIHEVDSSVITYYYNEKNYGPCNEGTPLGNSCMRGNNNTEQIKFYEDNPDAVKLIVYIKNKKLEGRALLWKGINGNYMVDRIYYISSNTGTEIARYCKNKGYKTIFNNNASSYGLATELEENVIVKLDKIDGREWQPYYDSMKYIDIVNGFISTRKNAIAEYAKKQGIDFVVLTLEGYQLGNINPRQYHWMDEGPNPLQVGGRSEHLLIRDIEGKALSSFRDVGIVQRPFKGLMNLSKIVYLYPEQLPIAEFFAREIINKYNCLRPTLIISKKHEIKIADKKDTVYSRFHNNFILKKESKFVEHLHDYVLTNVEKDPDSRKKLQKLKVKKIFKNKLVCVRPEGIEFLQQQFALLPDKIGLSAIRPSRTFMVREPNITPTSIILKGIPVPLKYIKIIKKS